MKGVLYFRLNDSFKARMWQQHRSIKDLDLALHEAQSRWIRVDRARKSVPNNNGEFAARVADLKARIEALQVRLAETQKKQTGYLAQLAIHELDEQKDRLAAYQVQARFALASMYDRAANEDTTHKKEPGAALPKSCRSRTMTRRPDAAFRQDADSRRRAAFGHRAAGCRRFGEPEAMRPSVAAAVALVLVACAAPACLPLANAADDSNKTIKDLKSKDIPIHKDSKVDASSSKAMDNYRRFLELQKTDPALRAEALRRLGDLNLDAGDIERMEKEVGLVDLQSAEAIKLYATLLKAYPDYARNDQVLYQLARAYETTGQPEQALATLDHIVQKYPEQPVARRSAVPPRRVAVFRQTLPGSRARVRGSHPARQVVRLLRAEPLQAWLVAVQAVDDRGEPVVVRRRVGSHAGPRTASRCRSRI